MLETQDCREQVVTILAEIHELRQWHMELAHEWKHCYHNLETNLKNLMEVKACFGQIRNKYWENARKICHLYVWRGLSVFQVCQMVQNTNA